MTAAPLTLSECSLKTLSNDRQPQYLCGLTEMLIKVNQKTPCSGNHKKIREPAILADSRIFQLVEVTGLEPAASTSLTWRSSQTEPHLESHIKLYCKPANLRAANQIWTGDLILTKDALYRLSYSSKLNLFRSPQIILSSWAWNVNMNFRNF